MEKIKRFSSSLFVVFIFMNHLIPSIHAFEHQNDNISTISSNELEYNQTSNITEHCCFCDIYFNVDYSQFQSSTYSLIIPSRISDYILNKEKTAKDVVLFRKKSRAPPSSAI